MDLKIAEKQEQFKLESFLVFNNGERNRNLAKGYIKCMFSDDYRKPTFVLSLVDDEIIGAAAYSEEFFTTNTWGVSWVSVHKDFRNQGIGQKLVEFCLKNIYEEAQKKVSVILCTYPNKTKLYEKIGFSCVGHDCSGGSFMFKVIGDSK